MGKEKKLQKTKMMFWGIIGGVAGWFAFNFTGVAIGILGGIYLAKKIE